MTPPKCDVCGREWERDASPWYKDMVVCRHAGPCVGHPEGETCQYYYDDGHAALRMVE